MTCLRIKNTKLHRPQSFHVAISVEYRKRLPVFQHASAIVCERRRRSHIKLVFYLQYIVDVVTHKMDSYGGNRPMQAPQTPEQLNCGGYSRSASKTNAAVSERLSIHRLIADHWNQRAAPRVAGYRRAPDQRLINLDVVLSHPEVCEARLEHRPAGTAAQLRNARHRLHRLGLRTDDKPRHTFLQNLWHRPATKRNRGSSAGHGLDHRQAKWLRPVDRK